MKKILFLLVALIAIVSVNAQKVVEPNWAYTYAGASTDTIGVGTTTWNKTVSFSTPMQSAYVAQLKISDFTAGATATVALQAKCFETDAYSTLTTVTWTGINSTDSIITFNSTTAKNNYNYYKVLVTRTASKATINWFKIYIKK